MYSSSKTILLFFIGLFGKLRVVVLRSLWLGAFIGFLVIAVIGGPFPIVGHLIGGLIAGLVAGGGMSRGALSGFLAGIFG